MSPFTVRFTRYCKKTATRDNSAPLHMHADDWRGIERLAGAVLQGMRQADPDRDYDISAIVHDGLGGITHDGYLGIWSSYPIEVAA